MAKPLHVTFHAVPEGAWRIEDMRALVGDALPPAPFLDVAEGWPDGRPALWSLRGTTSNQRYTTRHEADALVARQQGLGRTEAVRAALIPIRKTEAWWALAQDERRAIMEEQSRHTAIGLEYLPGVARRLHHSREFGEPFDFLTWFEFAPAHEGAFNELLARLRDSAEWRYVDREVEIRLTRA